MLVDLHLHSNFSFDSDEEAEKYIVGAVKAGASVLGFSEHYDYDAVLDGADIAVADIPKYVASLEKLKERYGGQEILCGIEFGYRAEAAEHYRQLISKYNFDYIINSLHTLPERGDCYSNAFFARKPLKDSYFDYFKGVLESVRADFDYQIIGHVGYVSRYRTGEGSRILYGDFSDILDEILLEIIRRDKCLEINTSTGLSNSKFLPDCDILDRYLQLGGEKLSFGSDAHSADKYLRKYKDVEDYLKSAGVKYLFYYKNRKPVAYKI